MRKTKGADYLIPILENLKDLAFVIILFSSILYRRQLKLTRWKRKLSAGELTMYIILSIALPVYGILYFMFLTGT